MEDLILKKRDSKMSENISSECKLVLDSHLADVKNNIISEAKKLGKGENGITPAIIIKAAVMYAPGHIIKENDDISFFQRLLSSISGITVVTAILAIVFGLIGSTNSGDKGWIDIAKIFAGAVVGSTGAGAISHIKKLNKNN